jgi:transposase
MAGRFNFASLIPLGLMLDSVDNGEDTLVVTARSSAVEASCPVCGATSRRVQSHHIRRPSDLPCSGRHVRLRLLVRRFRCDVPGCQRQVFAERFDAAVVAERGRRTERLEAIVHHLGLAMGGRPGAGFAQRLMLPVSNDTLLRVVRRRALPRTEKLAVIGIDDWAYRRNHRYGTIICDLERRQMVALLPDREQATAEAWLRQHSGISIVSRDRGGGYGEAVARALPDAIQVADRWHLMENASAAFLDAVRLSMPAVRGALAMATIDPALLTAAERLQYEGFLRREDTARQILTLKEDGHSIKEIVRRTRYSRKLVRQTVRGVRGDIFRVRQSSLDAYLPVLDAEWASGCRNGAELWRRLREQGFQGSLRVVSEWTTRRRRADQMQEQGLKKAPSAAPWPG